jgi:hypothetical protein
MQLRRIRNCFTALAVAALTAGSAMATQAYITKAAWVTALTNAGGSAGGSAFSGTVSNTLFSGSYGPFIATGTQNNQLTFGPLQDTTGTMTITAPSGGTHAVFLYLASDHNTNSYVAEPLTITLTDTTSGTQTFSLTTGTAPLAGPWGFTSGAFINTITISAPSGYNVDLVDFYAGSGTFPADTTSVPEVTTLLMIGTGLVVIGARRKFMPLTTA